jgi:hypothetical protein
MKIDDMTEAQFGLLFDMRRSARYHDRRRAFFEVLHKITSVLTILLAGSVIFGIAHDGAKDPAWLVSVALAASLLSAFDLVVGYANKAALHRELKNRFSALQISILCGGATEDEWIAHERERLQIEQDEPPVYRALDLLCHNELLKAEGYSPETYEAQRGRLNWLEKATSQFIKWQDIGPAQEARRQKVQA